jgi:hypothetical protein
MKYSLIIWYELTDPEINSHRLVQKIKSYRTWARLGNSAYLICTDQPPISVRNELVELLGADDKIFVSTTTRPSAWRGLSESVGKWIVANQKKLPEESDT